MSEKSVRLNWEEISKIAYQECRNYYEQNDNALTLRGLFYILVSKNVIPNTKNSYKTLSDILAKKRYNGEFPVYLLKDVTRKSSSRENSEYFARELTEEEIKEKIQNLIESYTSYSINPWIDQKYRVIITLEKEALYDITTRFVDELQVDGMNLGVYRVVCMKGFDSATDIINLAETIERLKKDGYEPVVLLISDFDPSGEEIFSDFKRRLEMLVKQSVTVEKILITKEQIMKYNLPSAPESAEELAKLRRDPRYKKFIEAHGLMRVETDAMYSLYPDVTKQIIHNAVLKYFDLSIYNQKTKQRLEKARIESEYAKNKSLENLKKILK